MLKEFFLSQPRKKNHAEIVVLGIVFFPFPCYLRGRGGDQYLRCLKLA